MAGLIGLGQAYREQGNELMRVSSGLETRRNEERQLAREAKTNSIFSGAATGAMVGNMIAPGIGIPVGAAVGILAGGLF